MHVTIDGIESVTIENLPPKKGHFQKECLMSLGSIRGKWNFCGVQDPN
jgi:hypothetical protein